MMSGNVLAHMPGHLGDAVNALAASGSNLRRILDAIGSPGTLVIPVLTADLAGPGRQRLLQVYLLDLAITCVT